MILSLTSQKFTHLLNIRMNHKEKKQIFFALKDEVSPEFLKGDANNITIMGMGKLNAAIALTNYLQENPNHKDLVIINLGTAGSRKFPVGTLVEITDFFERGIVFRSQPIKINALTDLPKGKCGSGDLVEELNESLPWDCVDMEAYSLAKICYQKSISFVSIKYITDVSDDNVKNDWKKNLGLASAELFQFWTKQLKNKSF